MRWSYKTVQYGYKKEGLLGGAFLDETEIEESMNEFGRAGWELVSLLEVQEGLIATFKQPIDAPAMQDDPLIYQKKRQETGTETPPRFLRPERLQKTREEVEDDLESKESHSVPGPQQSIPTKGVKKRSSGDNEDGGAGSIRIE